jgi:hypothetical protein
MQNQVDVNIFAPLGSVPIREIKVCPKLQGLSGLSRLKARIKREGTPVPPIPRGSHHFPVYPVFSVD